ncbi:MAG: 2-oxo-4-hydroxy-4-carboxy-5-ureidoimidazoline decarboxylase [Woeseia sp.]
MVDADRAGFLRRFGGIYEHSPWVAEQAYAEAAGLGDPEKLAEVFARCVDAADDERKLALIRAHPDLAVRAAAGALHTDDLTAASREEQASAGIDQCTKDEFRQFQDLNRRYKEKFGFPFVMAVRNSNKHEILAAFATRLENDAHTEFDTAIAEIHKIARLRLLVGARHCGRPPQR